jgi:hypothetical protein
VPDEVQGVAIAQELRHAGGPVPGEGRQVAINGLGYTQPMA